MRSLRRQTLTAFLLGVLLALTGVTLGHARGSVMAGGEVILCTGSGPVVLTLDAGGNPTGALHVCPDMALGLIAGLAPPAVLVPRPAGLPVAVEVGEAASSGPAGPLRAPAARGPPLAV